MAQLHPHEEVLGQDGYPLLLGRGLNNLTPEDSNFPDCGNPIVKAEVEALQGQDPAGGNAWGRVSVLVCGFGGISTPSTWYGGGGPGPPLSTLAGVLGPPLPPPLLDPLGAQGAAGRWRGWGVLKWRQLALHW